MATETRPQVDAAEVYSRLGRIEGEQAQMNLRFDDMNARLDRLEAGYKRIQRLAIIGGIVIFVLVWMTNLLAVYRIAAP